MNSTTCALSIMPNNFSLSRGDYKKKRELDELRKADAAPPEIDDDGNMIDPHIPQYIKEPPCTSPILWRVVFHRVDALFGCVPSQERPCTTTDMTNGFQQC